MKFNLVKFSLLFLACFSLVPAFTQQDTISSYNSLFTCSYLSSIHHPIQIARILPDRPGSLHGIQLHLSGARGTCQVHIFGHEGGTNFPSFANDLTPPIELVKTQEGDTSIMFYFSDSIKLENDQFYVVLNHFKGDFGVKQDSTYFEEFCGFDLGGHYYPSILLSRDSSEWIGDNCNMTIDAYINYAPVPMPIFKEVTAATGLPIDLSRYTAAWADVNNDYWVDLLLGQHLYINKGGTFESLKLPVDSLSKNPFKTSAFIDMNNDGHWDIILFGSQKSWLLINDGNGNFERHLLTIPKTSSLQAFSIADINQDQYPDLILAQLWGKYPEPKPNYLLLNNGQLGFTNITQRLYPQSNDKYNFPNAIPCTAKVDSTYLPNQNRNRRSRATQFIDYDQDGDADLYITNYFLETDEFYKNDGQGNFTQISAPKPLGQSDTTSNHGTGLAWYDYDNDGDFDVLIPQLAHPRNMTRYDHRGTTLYRNEKGIFKDVSSSSGIQFEETHAGSSFGDVNNDGLVDLLTTVYYGCHFIDLYLQESDHTFQISTSQSGFSKLSTGSDVSFIDYNNDGQLDLVLGKEGAFRLFENILPSSNNWMKLNFISASHNHLGIGAIVKVYAEDQVYTQEIGAGKGQGMQSPTTLHFGLGSSTMIDKVEVWFGEKKVASMQNLKVNSTYILKED